MVDPFNRDYIKLRWKVRNMQIINERKCFDDWTGSRREEPIGVPAALGGVASVDGRGQRVPRPERRVRPRVDHIVDVHHDQSHRTQPTALLLVLRNAAGQARNALSGSRQHPRSSSYLFFLFFYFN